MIFVVVTFPYKYAAVSAQTMNMDSQSTIYTRDVEAAVIRAIFLDPCMWAVVSAPRKSYRQFLRRPLSRMEAIEDAQGVEREVLNTADKI
jgi:hypothetical protein